MHTRQRQHEIAPLFHDISIVVLSLVVALILVQSDVLIRILTSTKELELFGSFIAGMFFTTIFTTAPAIVTLGEIAQVQNIWVTAFMGALGAVIGDLVIFRFVKDRLSGHLVDLVTKQGGKRRIAHLMRSRLFRYFTFFAGGFIIASPLPDELGVSILGMARIKSSWFVGLSFVFNFIGIVVIGLAARALY
ncbi:MAG: hypothetical protein KBD16_01560 [Candidatus Pacebacteria bacterium]|nr:hypothetical protein [Candidatus Paceibacterota bacterium]